MRALGLPWTRQAQRQKRREMSPRVVDPAARRSAIAEAVFRVVERDGIEQASLRTVAAEAGLAIGSIRHYFDSQDDMIVFAAEALCRSVDQRVLAQSRSLDEDVRSACTAERVLIEVLPLDGSRPADAALLVAFTTAARTRPSLTPHTTRLYDGVRAFCHRVLTAMSESGAVAGDLDLVLEAQRLSSLLSGLVVDGVLHPDRMPPELSLSLVRRHFESLR
ncbi:TetR/AcrR family transcriptional regulator [Lentzea sp. HUAS12]|uniref:TetR/AcrR family transcriptional regulator n=1 Tax=Lentzea sp. HUAS12 TaxID=2951806 RepID=UPI0020A01BE8|nr:TetR family transcriptional regulator C-terminal domain-containing protein [Lentzea sp. HUAS12]USX54016.1 TetR family transcriptional regulator C-terminal domain-containing protein [Lentzea sp. HUAS12]